MSVYIYKKHPDHNLGGENYPHFRNKADKWNYVKKELVNTQKPIKLHITRVSFDTARLTLNVKKFLINSHPTQIAGLMTDSAQYLNLEFWFVVGWSFGSNENVVILELQLDYWLTYWPLKFNKALVRINRKHMNRFTTESTLDDLKINFNSSNRQLQIPEKTAPPAIYNENYYYFKFIPHFFNGLVLMKGIVVAPVGGEEEDIEFSAQDNYMVALGSNSPGEQNGFLIFGRNSNPNLNSWLSFPGVTHAFYFFMEDGDLHTCEYNVKIEPERSGHKPYTGLYTVNVSSEKSRDVKKRLNMVAIGEYEIGESGVTYQQIGTLISRLIGLTYYINTKSFNSKLKILFIDQDGLDYRVKWNLQSNVKSIFLTQLISLKSFYRNLQAKPGLQEGDSWLLKDQVVRQYGDVFFTTLNAFNYYMKYKSKYKNTYFKIDPRWEEVFRKTHISKEEYYNADRELKMYTHNKYFITFQNETHEINPVLYSGHYVPYWFVSLQKSYFILEPWETKFQPFNKKYNMVCANKSQFINYTDNSLEFYQKQGFQFETGINQAKYQLNWTKRFNQFSVDKFYYDSTMGTLSNMFNRTTAMGGFAGKFGNTQMMAGLAIGAGVGLAESIGNTYFGYENLQLQNEMKEKQAYYNLKMLQSKQQDIFNNPVSTNNVTDTELSYNLISSKILPRIVTLTATEGDFYAQANLYHKYGNLNDQAEIVDLNNKWNRRCWNFWEIHNIEQAIVKDDLNHKVITFFNTLFNQGVRLWNVFNEEVVFNDYSLENWESKLLEDEK